MVTSNFKMTYEVINESTKNIHVRIKGGIGYKVDPVEHPPLNPSPYVRVKIIGVNLLNLKIDSKNALTAFDRKLLSMMEAQRQRSEIEQLSPSINIYNQTIDVCVYLESSLVEKNQAIHSEILGVTLYTGHYDREIPAINTPAACLQDIKNEQDNSTSLNMSMELIDPENRMGVLWTNCLGKAKPINRSNRPGMLPGLYVVFNGANNEPVNIHWPIDKMDNKILRENGIFMTEREAIEGGNTERLIYVEKQLSETQKENRNYEAVFVKLNATISSIESKLIGQQSDAARSKQTAVIKELFHKQELSMLKNKSSLDEFGSFVKNVSTVSSLAFSLYKLLA